MVTPAPSARCPLCASPVPSTDREDHLRAFHQVAPGETTVADVPVGRWDWLRAAPFARELDEELAVAGAT